MRGRPVWRGRGALLAGLAAVLAAAPGPGAPPSPAAARAQAADARAYFRIARRGDAASFASLREALESLEREAALASAYGACALYAGTAVGDEVAAHLERVAMRAASPARQLAAASALAYFWRSAAPRLERLVDNHPAAACRAVALEPLLPALARRGDAAACRRILGGAQLDAETEPAVRAALRACRGRAAQELMARRLRESGLSKRWKILLLDLVWQSDGASAARALEERAFDADREVRLRALRSIGERGDAQVLARLRERVDRGEADEVAEAILALAARRDADPLWIRELFRLTESPRGAVRRASALALGELPTREALALLHRLLEDPERPVQMAALQQLARRRQAESIPRLIHALETAGGLMRMELARQLRLFTGEDHGLSAQRWQTWFQGEGAGFTMPDPAEALARERERTARQAAEGQTVATFYGLQIYSDRVCFVLDTSGSMQDRAAGRFTTSDPAGRTRLDVAREELSTALKKLLDGVAFNVVTFADRAESFRAELVELSPKTRTAALRFVKGWQADGGTALYDALALVLADERVDTVYLLTDGEPTAGAIQDPAAIRSAVRRLVGERLVLIHGVAIGRESALLRWLAEDSGGQYVQID